MTVGLAASVQLVGSDPDADPLTWSATGLPPGVVLNAGSGLISRTPSASGACTVQVGVSDGRGGSAATNFNWSVIDSSVVISPVAAPAVTSGGTATYTASVTGAGLQYQWDFGDGTPATAYSSNGTVALRIVAPGIYTVTLSVRHASGKTTTRSFVQTVLGSSITGRAPSSSGLAFEARSLGNARVWIVNPDNDSVSVFDAVSNAKLAEIAVGSQPRTIALAASGRLWVANKASASVSIVDPATLGIVQAVSLPRGSAPYGVVAASDGSVLVALEASGRVQKLSAAGAVLVDVPLTGARHLSLSLDGTRLLVSRFITAPQPGEGTTQVKNNLNGVFTGGEVTELDPSNLTQRRACVLRHSARPDSTISGRGVPNYLGAAAIAPDGKSAWVPSKKDSATHSWPATAI